MQGLEVKSLLIRSLKHFTNAPLPPLRYLKSGVLHLEQNISTVLTGPFLFGFAINFLSSLLFLFQFAADKRDHTEQTADTVFFNHAMPVDAGAGGFLRRRCVNNNGHTGIRKTDRHRTDGGPVSVLWSGKDRIVPSSRCRSLDNGLGESSYCPMMWAFPSHIMGWPMRRLGRFRTSGEPP